MKTQGNRKNNIESEIMKKERNKMKETMKLWLKTDNDKNTVPDEQQNQNKIIRMKLNSVSNLIMRTTSEVKMTSKMKATYTK